MTEHKLSLENYFKSKVSQFIVTKLPVLNIGMHKDLTEHPDTFFSSANMLLIWFQRNISRKYC